LKYRAPKGAMNPELKQWIAANEGEIRALLTKDQDFFDRQIRVVIDALNDLGVRMMDIPEATRHRAFEIEKRLTYTGNAGDKAGFIRYLEEWRKCFH